MSELNPGVAPLETSQLDIEVLIQVADYLNQLGGGPMEDRLRLLYEDLKSGTAQTATPSPTNEYKCAMCGETFAKTWTDDEALAECEQYFGVVPAEQRAIVCDDCFQKIHPAEHPEEVAATKIKLGTAQTATPSPSLASLTRCPDCKSADISKLWGYKLCNQCSKKFDYRGEAGTATQVETSAPLAPLFVWKCCMCGIRICTYQDFNINQRPNCVQCNAEMGPETTSQTATPVGTPALTQFVCDCGRRLLVEGKVIGKRWYEKQQQASPCTTDAAIPNTGWTLMLETGATPVETPTPCTLEGALYNFRQAECIFDHEMDDSQIIKFAASMLKIQMATPVVETASSEHAALRSRIALKVGQGRGILLTKEELRIVYELESQLTQARGELASVVADSKELQLMIEDDDKEIDKLELALTQVREELGELQKKLPGGDQAGISA